MVEDSLKAGGYDESGQLFLRHRNYRSKGSVSSRVFHQI
jgi:hypothetical protein